MKKCINCKELKSEVEFYKHPKKEGETINSCKKCVIRRVSKRNRDKGDERKGYMKSYREKNKAKLLEQARVRDKKKRETSDVYKLRYNLSHNLRECLKRSGRSKGNSISTVIGCSMEELVLKLNDNPYDLVYGVKGVDIDHIVPTSTAHSKDELLSLYHYSNLQLLPSYYNRHVKKNNEFSKTHFEEWLKKR